MTPLTVNRISSKIECKKNLNLASPFIKCYLTLVGQKEKKKRNSNLSLASRKEKLNLNLASLFLISSILFYLDHPFHHSTRYTLYRKHGEGHGHGDTVCETEESERKTQPTRRKKRS